MNPVADYYKREEFKKWLIDKKVNQGELTKNTVDQYPTYVGYIFDGRDMTKDERQNFSSAMEMYKEFIKTLP